MISKRVMVIDDDRGICDLLKKSLEGTKGHEVSVVERAAEGLQRLMKEDFDLVLLALNMSEISGQAICTALRKQEKTRKIPVVMMTAAFQTPQQVEEMKKEYGVSAFLQKPFSVAELFTAIGPHSETAETVGSPSVPHEQKMFAGTLSKTSLPLLLHSFYQQKLTGLLHIQKNSAKKVIYIDKGYPIFVRSNILSECLGRMLVKQDVITQVDCDQSIENSKTSGRLQGTELIGMGLLTPQELHDALKRQVVDKMLNVFAWREGLFRFVHQQDFKKNIAKIELSPASLILEGIIGYWDQERVTQYLQAHLNDYLKQSENPLYLFQEMGLSRRGEEVFAECLGDLTLAAILERHPLSKQEVQPVLAALLISGMVISQACASRLDDKTRAQRKANRPIDGELRKQILEDYKRIMTSDYFSALEIGHKCDNSSVRRAYYKLAKQYHPDRFLGRGLSSDMENKVNEIFGHITQAYTVLGTQATRSAYQDELENGPKIKVDVNQVIEAETAFQQGRALLKARQYKSAAAKLKISIEISPEEPEYLTSYAWSIFKSAPDKIGCQNQALEILLASRELNPGLEDTHLFLGYVYQALGQERRAEKSFEMAVQANPKCTEALRELRLINLRRERPESAKGLFKKFRNRE